MPDDDQTSVVPAQLSFLAIYNPSLGPTDETLHDQIVFYSSKTTGLRQRGSSADDSTCLDDKDGENERLRQIGLAQGMVNFAKNFSEGNPVENAETEKSRIVLHELENDWWILASIDLTRLPSTVAGANSTQADSTPSGTIVEYSSREVIHPHILIQQLRKAHSIFLLHHDISLDSLYYRLGRSKFCQLLARFWNKFVWNWTVLLNGNPAVEAYNAVKLAAGGELGIGVGEEEWGSGEREVLEHFISRTHGLVDLVVSRFGDAANLQQHEQPPGKLSVLAEAATEPTTWLGSESDAHPSDGVIFSGVGAISRESLCQVTHWMEWIYKYGEEAYGICENPSSTRRRRQKRGNKATSKTLTDESDDQKPRAHLNIPPPLVTASPSRRPLKESSHKDTQVRNMSTEMSAEEAWNTFGTENLMKYLTLGYGSAWRFPSMTPDTQQEDQAPRSTLQNNAAANATGRNTSGKFIIGLRDDLENEDTDEDESEPAKLGQPQESDSTNRRTVLRTLHLRMAESVTSSDGEENATDGRYKKLQVVVYVHQPFIFTFLFDLRTPTLTCPSFYRSIHHQLGPLQKSLLASTSPTNVSRRIFDAPDNDAGVQRRRSLGENPIYDLVYDPSNLTVRSSIPNIPDPNLSSFDTSPSRRSDRPAWSRVEALNVHNRILSTYIDTRNRPLEVERTCKTSRGWWLTWVRVPGKPMADQSGALSETQGDGYNHPGTDISLSPPPREAFIAHKAGDAPSHSYSHGGGSGSRFLRDLSGASVSNSPGGSAAGGAKNLTEGLGFDAQKYIESILSLNR